MTRQLFASAGKRTGMATAAIAMLFCMALAACSPDKNPWNAVDISGTFPDLQFDAVRADDGKEVTAADYRGKIVLLYFGYTFCPNVCPVTLANLASILQKLGADADQVRILFVTVDPGRDNLKALKQYADAFAPQVDGLRPDANQIASMAKRYRVAYSVKPSPDPDKYVVTHSAAVYFFDRNGKARLLENSLHTDNPKIQGITDDLKRLIGEADEGDHSLLSWL